MTKQKIKQAAPMPKKEDDIKNNSMKLYSYLVCLSGLADYPENTRMFRQKNLILSQIKNSTGITDKTVKLYLYYLEEHGLIRYCGENKFNFLNANEYNTSTEYRLAAIKYASEVWKSRKKEPNSVYHIPRPIPYTPVPEITLQRLNNDFKITELELSIYLFLCKYRDECVINSKNFKAITYEQLRDILDLKKNSETDKTIFSALTFLEKLGLIQFTIGYTCNAKMAKIPVFKINEVGYYIGEPIICFNNQEILSIEEQEFLKDINRRIILGYNKECGD